jgi:hypothetical protein
MSKYKCDKCCDTGWVCESHLNKTWESGLDNDCDCGGAGASCSCNPHGHLPNCTIVVSTGPVGIFKP